MPAQYPYISTQTVLLVYGSVMPGNIRVKPYLQKERSYKKIQ
ncbi:MAG: hypothetical protein ABI851_11630 [Saprospiraceae bacterium]